MNLITGKIISKKTTEVVTEETLPASTDNDKTVDTLKSTTNTISDRITPLKKEIKITKTKRIEEKKQEYRKTKINNSSSIKKQKKDQSTKQKEKDKERMLREIEAYKN